MVVFLANGIQQSFSDIVLWAELYDILSKISIIPLKEMNK